MTPREQAAAARRGAGLFRLEDRALLVVEGGDRVRWLDAMVSNDVAGLEPGPQRSGCHALLLSRQGRIVADFHVLLREDAFWLETEAPFAARVLEALGKFIIADDVQLRDASTEHDRLGLEGPAAEPVLAAAVGAPLALAPDACVEVEISGVPLLAAAFGWSGAPARQLFVPAGEGGSIARRLLEVGRAHGLLEAAPDALEILRIEAGTPRLGMELDEEVLPAEARLERAISFSKGCYTGQEVVARMESRGRVAHKLVGLCLAGEELPAVGAELCSEGRRVGEVTSACVSELAGAIALGYVRVPHDAPGVELEADGLAARVCPLPFPGVGPP